ncbi:MAG: hypothetical protein ABFC78_09850 [Methanoregula sp.]
MPDLLVLAGDYRILYGRTESIQKFLPHLKRDLTRQQTGPS